MQDFQCGLSLLHPAVKALKQLFGSLTNAHKQNIVLCTNCLIKWESKNSHQIVSINAFLMEWLHGVYFCSEDFFHGRETATFQWFHCFHGDADFSLAFAVVMKLSALARGSQSTWKHQKRILGCFEEGCQQTNNWAITPSVNARWLFPQSRFHQQFSLSKVFATVTVVNCQHFLLDDNTSCGPFWW